MLRRLIYLPLPARPFIAEITFILRFFADILPVASTEGAVDLAVRDKLC
jgi:hypothetical protein